MQIKYTAQYLHKLEDMFAESDYILRYEKGNFKSGYCVLKDAKVVIINKYFTSEGKINCLIEIARNVEINVSAFSERSKKLYQELKEVRVERA
jgi:hypothetical protein